MTNQTMVKMVLDAWDSKIKEADDIFEKISDEQLQLEVAPNRNRGVYLLGHLTAVHDRLLPLLGFGERIYLHLDELFIKSPDKTKELAIPTSDLRAYWKNMNSTLADHFNKLSPEAWFEKHTAVSSEDFIKQPYRNKLNVVLSRTTHLSYHLGQLIFLKK